MSIIRSSQEWLQRIGKERFQAFQDAFTRAFGISLCLMDLEGRTLTVWSNSSLFCHYMMQNSRMRCMKERENAINFVIKNRKPRIFTCYLGLSFFLCPIFYGDDVICLAYGGGVISENAQKINAAQNAYHVPVISEKKLKNISELLNESLNLLNFDLDIVKNQNNVLAEETDTCKIFDEKLSRRESEIAKLICDGLSNKEIAHKLFISEKTVKTHVSNILTKLEMKDRMQLAICYRELQL